MKWKPKKGNRDGRKKEKKKLEESRDKNQPKTALIKYPNSSINIGIIILHNRKLVQ